MDASLDRFEKLRRYLAQDPGNTTLCEETSEIGLQLGRYAETSELLLPTIALCPEHQGLRFRLGTAQLALAQYKSAIQQFETLIELGNRHPAILYNLAYAWSRLGDMVECRAVLLNVPAADRNAMPEAGRLLALACHHTEDWETGTATLEELVALHPGDAEAWGQLALLSFDADDIARAQRAADKALAITPSQSTALSALGGIALESRDMKRTLDYFGRAVESNPRNGRAWSGLAFGQLLALNAEGAADSFNKAVEFMPGHLGTWHGLGWVQLMLGDLAAARRSFEKALDLDRNFADTHGALAVVAALEGRERDSELSARRASGLNRRSFPAQYAKSLLLARKGEVAQAEALLQDLMQRAPAEGNFSTESLVADLVGDLTARKRTQH